MKLRFSPITFAVAYCLIYGFVFARDWPLFRYYPLHGDFNWGNAMIKNAGPAMSWYGFVADSAIGAFVLSVLVPNRLMDRVFRDYVWLFPCAVMVFALYLLRQLFVGHALG